MAGKPRVSAPYSRMKLAIAEILAKEGYVSELKTVKNPLGGSSLSIVLSYKNGRPAITGVKRISKPSRRMYMGVQDLKPVKRGYGLLVLSTPSGVITGKEAREKRVGGEALFEIW
jgi:small subunit ribosomal protein S8